MKKFKENKSPDYYALSKEIRKFWESEKIFQNSISNREKNPKFVFYEGPPSANGKPGIHHVMSRTIKDIFCRYKTMRGFKVDRKGGWDTHGLPVELQVEKELGITKDDIGIKISIEEYNKKCKESVMKYTEEWNEITKMMGYWVDLDNPYVTYQNGYIESVWNILSELHKKGFLYKGKTIQPYSPAAGTGLSSHELNQPGAYKLVKDTSIVAQFKIKRDDLSKIIFNELGLEEEAFFLAWTTTPWTLPANSALAVGKNIDYILVKTFNQYTHKEINVILAKNLIGKYFNEKSKEIPFENYKPGDKLIPFKVLKEIKGDQLKSIRYEQLMPYIKPNGKAFEVIIGDFVTTEDGTGIVHIAPTFGSDDFRIAKQNGICSILVNNMGIEVPIVNESGSFVSQITDFAGMEVKNYSGLDKKDPSYKSTDVLISIKLKEENKAFKVEKFEHSYPHCWRTDKPIIYYPMDSWFIKTTAVKERLIELNKKINWKPEHTGSGRFGNWLENLVDWNLSRSRYWGTPLPIWRSVDGSIEICIGSIDDLVYEIEVANSSGLLIEGQLSQNKEFLNLFKEGKLDIHIPFIDQVFLTKDGEVLCRESDIIDVWFDSGSMPYAQNNSMDLKGDFKADLIAEGIDQTRGWFFTLHAISVMLFDDIAFKNVIANGLVLDKNGNKMSKRLGNVIDPFQSIEKYGPDTIRWYMIGNSSPWENLKFDLEGVEDVRRKFFGTLSNTWTFFAIYANMYNIDIKECKIPVSNMNTIDKWIHSKLNTLIREVRDSYDLFEPTKVVRLITEFVCEDVSNWYVRLNRRRFWKGEYDNDKIAAFQTLYTCLETISRLMAPISPFYADMLFRNGNEITSNFPVNSVHLTDFPDLILDNNFQEIENKMDLVKKIVSMAHSIRKIKGINVRQPLSEILIPILNSGSESDKEYIDLILSEVNVLSLGTFNEDSDKILRKVKPNTREIAKKYSSSVPMVLSKINNISKEEVNKLISNGEILLGDFLITKEDVIISIEGIEGWEVMTENGISVALKIEITTELRKIGIAREVVSSLQNMRKSSNLDVLDRISLRYRTESDIIKESIESNRDYIGNETLSKEILIGDLDELKGSMEIKEGKVDFYFSKI